MLKSYLVMILLLAAYEGDCPIEDLVAVGHSASVKHRHVVAVGLIRGVKQQNVWVLL